MSQVGPVTPTTSELLGISAGNLNAAAERRLRAAEIQAHSRLAQAEIQSRERIAAAQIDAEKEMDASRQKGFDKQREFEAAQGEANRAAAAEQLQTQIAAEEASFARQAELEKELISKSQTFQLHLRDLEKREQEERKQKNTAAVRETRRQQREIEVSRRKVEDDLAAVNFTTQFIRGEIRPAAVAEASAAATAVGEGLTQQQQAVQQSVAEAATRALATLVADRDFRKVLSSGQPDVQSVEAGPGALRTPRDHAAATVVNRFTDALMQTPVLQGRAESVSAGNALSGFLNALLTEDSRSQDAETSTGAKVSKELSAAMHRVEHYFSPHEIGEVVFAFRELFDARAEGNEVMRAVNILDNEGKYKPPKGMNKRQAEAFEELLDRLAALPGDVQSLGYGSMTDAHERFRNTVSRGIAAFSMLDPAGAEAWLREAERTLPPEQVEELQSRMGDYLREIQKLPEAEEQARALRSELFELDVAHTDVPFFVGAEQETVEGVQ